MLFFLVLNLQFLRLTFKRRRDRLDFLLLPLMQTFSPWKEKRTRNKKINIIKKINYSKNTLNAKGTLLEIPLLVLI